MRLADSSTPRTIERISQMTNIRKQRVREILEAVDHQLLNSSGLAERTRCSTECPLCRRVFVGVEDQFCQDAWLGVRDRLESHMKGWHRMVGVQLQRAMDDWYRSLAWSMEDGA